MAANYAILWFDEYAFYQLGSPAGYVKYRMTHPPARHVGSTRPALDGITPGPTFISRLGHPGGTVPPLYSLPLWSPPSPCASPSNTTFDHRYNMTAAELPCPIDDVTPFSTNATNDGVKVSMSATIGATPARPPTRPPNKHTNHNKQTIEKPRNYTISPPPYSSSSSTTTTIPVNKRRPFAYHGRPILPQLRDVFRSEHLAFAPCLLPRLIGAGDYPTDEVGSGSGDEPPPSGVVTVTASYEFAPITVSYRLAGLAPNSMGGLHIHTGTSCADAATVGGHFWTPMSSPDPWLGLPAMWQSDANGDAVGSFTVEGSYYTGNGYGNDFDITLAVSRAFPSSPPHVRHAAWTTSCAHVPMFVGC